MAPSRMPLQIPSMPMMTVCGVSKMVVSLLSEAPGAPGRKVRNKRINGNDAVDEVPMDLERCQE